MRALIACFGFCITAFCVSGIGKVKPSYSSFLPDVYPVGYSISNDQFGNAYIAYSTLNKKLKTSPGAFQTSGKGELSIYIIKLNYAGQLVWATYFGGSGGDGVSRIKTDQNGNLYMAGETTSQNFPVSAGAFQKNYYGNTYISNCFLVKMDTSGRFVWGTYFHSYNTNLNLTIYDLCIGPGGSVCIAGQTGKGLPTTGNSIFFRDLADSSNMSRFGYNEFSHGFIAEFNNLGNLKFCSYLGGQKTVAYTVAMDKRDNIYLWGTLQDTLFPEINYAIKKQYYLINGNKILFSFLLKINKDYAINWCSFFSSYDEYPKSLDVDSFCNIYSTGLERIFNSNIKLSLQLDTASDANLGSYAIKTDSSGILKYSFEVSSRLPYYSDGYNSSVLDQNGNLYLIVENIPDSSSEDKGFVRDTFYGSKLYPSGNSQLKILELNHDGKLIKNIDFGGSYCDFFPVCSVEPSGGIWISGLTSSADFPVSSSALQPKIDTTLSGFICHFTPCDLNVLKIPVHNFNDSLCQTPSLTLRAGIDSVLYSWSTGWNTESINVTDSGNYYVQINNGCYLDTIHFYVKKVDCNGYLYVPDAFSPNGDGINDIFIPKGANITQLNMVIVNRWGEIVATINNFDEGWNGNFHGLICSEGIYGYTLTAQSENGHWIYRKGNINLIR